MKKLHSFIATLLAFSIILSCFSATVLVSAETTDADVWDGTAATEFAGGDGTEANPFLIENGGQLFKAIYDCGMYNGAIACYLITNDIYLNEDYENYEAWGTTPPANNWTNVYTSGAFAGHLNGGYHTIYGLYFKGRIRSGLIPYLGSSGTLSNLIVEKSYLYGGTDTTAVLVGRLDKGTVTNCIARDSYVTNANNTVMGGIVAYANDTSAKIENCGAYNLTFSSGATVVGGILGKSAKSNASVFNCFSGGTFIFGSTSNIIASSDTARNYTDVDGEDKTGVLERTNSTTHPMTGPDALSVGMPRLLNTGVWKTTDGYPTFIGNGVKGEAWSGNKAAWYAGGKGTQADPFLIETGEQLYKAVVDCGMYNSTAAYYLITADIYLNSDYANYADWATTAPANNWYGTYGTAAFSGHLDGGYHTVYGMYFSGSALRGGLVQYLGGLGSISNLIVKNSYVYNEGDSTAVFAGRLDKGTISNCIACDSVISNSSNTVMAGIAAYAPTASSTISNCGAYGLTFPTDATVVGGILGKSTTSNTTVKSCYSGGTYIFGNTSNIGCSGSYTDIYASWKNGVTNLSSTPEKMQGAGAVANMGLSAAIWKDTESYPTLVVYNNGKKGEVWTGVMASGFAGGSGTEADPYLIETGEQLYKAISDCGMNGTTALYYLITADIYLNSDYENYADWATAAPANNWSGTYSSSTFSGHLDGGLHTVYGLYFNGSGYRAGLISYLGGEGTVSNLIVANSYVYGSADSTAVIVGRLDNGTVSNCIAHDSMVSNGSNKVMGGIVAYANSANAKIVNCGAYNLSFSEGATVVAGILANSATGNATVINCYSAGTYIFGNTGNISCAHSYTDVEHAWKYGVSNLSANPEKMVGAAAVEGMKYLDFINIWATVENGYPTLRAASDNNLSHEITSSYSVAEDGKTGVKFSSKVVMPAINPTYDDNIVITVDGVKKTVSEAGLIISREGVDVTDISTIENNPLTGYKVTGYKNGGENADIVIGGGYITVSAIVSGYTDYTAKSYILFTDGEVVMSDAYTAAPSTEETEVEGIRVNDARVNGDANFDGKINIVDIVRMKKYAAEGDAFAGKNIVLDIIDTNGDSSFNATDLAGLRQSILTMDGESPVLGMSLVFEDDFNSAWLDSSKWDFNSYMTGYGVDTVTTSDVQSIAADENGNGYLHLTSYKDDDGSYKAVKSISTGDKLTFVNGYLEIRAKVPTAVGAWPSFWLKSNTKNENLGYIADAPYQTEVDVFEVIGGKAISELHKHTYNEDGSNNEDIRYSEYYNRNSYTVNDNEWHTYGMLWTEDSIIMYVDGVEIQTYDLNSDYEGANGMGMEGFKSQPLCITINNYLFTQEYADTAEGTWTKDYVIGDDFTEAVYDIDYVRLYQDETGILHKAN